MATDTTSVGVIVTAVLSGVFTVLAAVIALIPPARKAKQDDRQYDLDQRKAQDAEEIALRAENRSLRAEADSQRKRAIEAEEQLHRKKMQCQEHGEWCSLTDEERAKRAGKPKSDSGAEAETE